VLNWGWALLVFPIVIFLLYRLVIRKEEAYMTTVFGESYLDYCHRVRRWI
jgi:protein-S-isoprenylcysteine O-methyltransferase Ste14